jgi:thiazole synthase ThiGH ThiG subunit
MREADRALNEQQARPAIIAAGLTGPRWAVALARRLGVEATMVESSLERSERPPFRERMEGK